jgi:hypothetical protein
MNLGHLTQPPGGRGPHVHDRLLVALVAVTAFVAPASVYAQARGGPPPAAPTARASAPIDLTGSWVSIIHEDWRYRMVTPPKGDYRRVPITLEALTIVNAWDPAADEAAGNACKSYGAGAIMRVPGRLRITWQDDNTLRVETDAGTQTRLFQFAPSAAPSAALSAASSATPSAAFPASTVTPSWQGTSSARWERPGGRGGGPGAPPPASGSLTVVTSNLRAGYLRKNGVPYSENARVTEYFDTALQANAALQANTAPQANTALPANTAPQAGGGQWLVVTTVVDDPRYLTQPFIVTSHFKKEADASKWDPSPCSATW